MSWAAAISLSLFHIGAVAALFMFDWLNFAVALFLYWLSTGLGISMGYHRLLTHGSYDAPRALEYFLAFCGALAMQGGPISWAATHRIHHRNSDKPGDPHSPRDGGWWAHIGWILLGEANHNDTRKMAKHAPDLAKSRYYSWLNTYHWAPIAALTILLFAIGGLPLVLWGVCLRTVVSLHATCLVNSATHMWGSRRFATRDDSRNNWLVALITFGEGWHNNHHAHPTSARHGLAWYEFDLSWIQIRILKLLGVVRSARVARLDGPVSARKAA
ncbi:MAG: fatty acid desaturase [Bryobacteraceae bacterium]|nr:fatty acid desaturase [Bryobacteraceae bacterium]